MNQHRLRVSPGNIKMGLVPSVSLPAVRTCGKVPCTKSCYVVCNMYRGLYGKSILASHQANLDLLLSSRDQYFGQLAGYLTKKMPRLFRFHVSGDFIDSDHLERTISLCRGFHSVGFLAFTKRHDLLPSPRRIPSNMALVASMWPNWGDKPKGYRAAWMQDGTEDRIPASAIECPGNCETCGACWSLRKIRRDVYFNKH